MRNFLFCLGNSEACHLAQAEIVYQSLPWPLFCKLPTILEMFRCFLAVWTLGLNPITSYLQLEPFSQGILFLLLRVPAPSSLWSLTFHLRLSSSSRLWKWMGLLEILLPRDPEPLWINTLQIQQPVLLLQPSLLASSTRLYEKLCREIAIGQVVVVKLSRPTPLMSYSWDQLWC